MKKTVKKSAKKTVKKVVSSATSPKKAVKKTVAKVVKKAAAKKTSVKKAVPTKKVAAPLKAAILSKAVVSKKKAAPKKVVLKKTAPPAVAPKKPAPPVVVAPKPAPVAPPVVAVTSEANLLPAELESFKAKLLDLRSRLSGNILTMADAALNKNRLDSSGDLSTMPIHMADVGSDNFEQEQTLSFMQNESEILDQVVDALERIKDGTYGICEGCGCRIPKNRLGFLPYVALCVKCADSFSRERY